MSDPRREPPRQPEPCAPATSAPNSSAPNSSAPNSSAPNSSAPNSSAPVASAPNVTDLPRSRFETPHGPFGFELLARAPSGPARVGVFTTPHGDVQTPAFMPVGTRGTVKGVLPRDLADVGSTMILANTLHLHLRPGEALVRELGGLHRFMAWDGPILTDSGGYQVFSMADISTLNEDGVTFKSIIDGARIHISPERAVEIQRALGADVFMAFDHCPADPTDRRLVEEATARTHRWLGRCRARYDADGGLATGQALFGIVQGGAFPELRQKSVDEVAAHGFVGNAIGGVSVGEDREQMLIAVEAAAPRLPEDRPRYLMGVGTPRDFLDAVARGVDLFDCVTPTRHGRNHQVWTTRGKVNVRNGGWKDYDGPLDPGLHVPHVSRFPLGVLRHYAVSDEMLAGMLLTLQNLAFFHHLMHRVREAIRAGTLEALRRDVLPIFERKLTPDLARELDRGGA
ncbi:MAG: tRNA guanosine(34) transglycosylase Tgt [Planctomycetota bacterium]